MKTTKIICATLLGTLAISLASCEKDENKEPWLGSDCINFESFTEAQKANPTSYGDNLYGDVTVDGVEWPHVYTFADSRGYYSHFNYTEASAWAAAGYYYYNGGIAVSDWSIREDAEGQPAGSWMEYTNQCSVYNTAVESGSKAAGHAGSRNFAVINGCGDDENSPKLGWFEFRDGNKAVTHKNLKLWICNSAYTYGVIMNGNAYAQSLKDNNGWFKIQAYGYDADGNLTNGGVPVEFYLANYSATENGGKKVEAISTWTEWDLSALGAVAKVKFNFKGSDAGAYGLNTPAYACIDDICYE